MAKASMMQLPLIHMNGSSKGQLKAQYLYAWHAVRAAIKALQENGPHSRDYYPLGADAWRQAEREHVERLQRLRTVEQELETILLHVDRGGKNEEST